MVRNNNRMSIRNAAKVVKRSRAYVRGLIDAGKVTAYRRGGSDEEPWLEVDLDELRTAVDRDSVWVPKGLKRKGKLVVVKPSELDPAVSDW